MSHPGIKGRAEARRRKYHRDLAKGQCVHCSHKLAPGKTMCQYHLDKAAEKAKIYYKKWYK